MHAISMVCINSFFFVTVLTHIFHYTGSRSEQALVY
jgi:hypothetical protein